MRSAALVALALGVAPGAPSCGAAQAASGALALVGRESFEVIEIPAAARLAAAGDVVLQARGIESAGRMVAAAQSVRGDEPLAEATAGRRFVVVSAEPELALRLGARLARDRAAHVTVVSGGLPAWGPPHEGFEPTEE